MTRFYLYYLKKRIPVLAIATGLFMILTIISLSTSQFIRTMKDYTANGDIVYHWIPGDNPFLYLMTIICITSTITPILEYSFKMKRRGVDLFYAFPISKRELYFAKFLLGLTEIFIVFIPQWIVSFIWVANSENLFDVVWFVWFLLAMLGFAVLLFGFFSFFYTQAHSILDGLLFMVFGTIFILLTANLVYAGVKGDNATLEFMFHPIHYFPYSPIYETAIKMYNLMCLPGYDIEPYRMNALGVAIFVILGIVATGLFFYYAKMDRAEDSGDLSHSYFGYKVMIPWILCTIFTICGQFSVLWVISAIGGYVLYAIYRRGFRLKKQDYFSLAISIIVGLTLAEFIINFF